MIKMMLENGRKRSTVSNSKFSLFFSLIDYRNNYYTSDDTNKIKEFYNSFKNRDQLIQWMKNRPKGAAYIYEVDGEKDVIVVIPTANLNGIYARECMENIFKGLHIIFVESGEIPDPYFNYAYNCNIGIRKAMEYNPKWIVVSNDDMYKIDYVRILKAELSALDNKEISFVLTNISGQLHSLTEHIGRGTLIRRMFMLSLPKYKEKRKLERKFGVRILTWREWYNKFILKVLYKEITNVKASFSFGIISSQFINDQNKILFDETYINGMEDIDLAMMIKANSAKVHYINYKIGSRNGSTLGTGESRVLRDLLNKLYFQEKFYRE